MSTPSQSLNRQLAEAARANDVPRVTGLIKIGADVNGRGRTLPVLWYATDEHVLQTLVEAGADVDVRWKGTTLLHSVALHDLQVVKTLLRLGADPNALDDEGDTPVFSAQYADRADIAEYLAANGADLNIQNSDGWTALHGAIIGGRYEVAKVLVQYGAKLELRDNDGATPFFSATDVYDIWPDDFVGLLIAHGADVNTERPRDGTRPIHRAAYHGYDELIPRMADAGADLLAQAFDGMTAREIAVARGFPRIAEVLRSLEPNTERD